MKKQTKFYDGNTLFYLGETCGHKHLYLVESMEESLDVPKNVYAIYAFENETSESEYYVNFLPSIFQKWANNPKPGIDLQKTPLTREEFNAVRELAFQIEALLNYINLPHECTDAATVNNIQENIIPNLLHKIYDTLRPEEIQIGQAYWHHNDHYYKNEKNVYKVVIEEKLADNHYTFHTQTPDEKWGDAQPDTLFEDKDAAINSFHQIVRKRLEREIKELQSIEDIFRYLAYEDDKIKVSTNEKVIAAFEAAKEMNLIETVPDEFLFPR